MQLRILMILLAMGMVAPVRAATPQQIADSIKKAKEYLYSRQSNGNWEGTDKIADHQKGGLTAIATYALLAAGESPQDPRLKPAIEWLKKAKMTGTYALGMRCQVWLLIPQTPEVKECIVADFKLLLDGLRKQAPTTGFYHYVCSPGKTMDHSCSQYGVLGAWACERAGLEVPSGYWRMVESGWKSSQDKSGGWSYGLKPTEKQPVIASMTAAGVATLFITQDYLHTDAGVRCTGNIKNADLDAGLKWLSDYFPKIGRNLYTLYGIERIGVASGYKYFGTINWYETCADLIVKYQAKTGSYGNAWGEIPGTSFGLLFLVRGGAPVVMNKLQYEQPDPAKPAERIEGPWNQRPRDAANVVKWVGRQIEKDLNWQIVNLKVNVDEFHDAPILYISGNEALSLLPVEVAKLKQFVEQGGLILGQADCGAEKFTKSFKDLGKKLFPAFEFRELPTDHPIYNNEQFMRSKWKNKPSVLGLSNDARELMLLIPSADAGKYWQLQDDKGHEELYQLAANIFLYSVDKQNLRSKGETYLEKADPKARITRTIKLARLEYKGNWDPEPGGWRRLANVMLNDNSVKLDVQPVKLGSGKLSGFKVAHLTGTTKFTLPSPEREELRKWIQDGGSLIVDSTGGNIEFTGSVEDELALLFPDMASDLKQPIPADHAIFGTGTNRIDEVNFRAFARRTLGSLSRPQLRRISIKDRTAIVFSREDLSCGLVGQPMDGIVGYDPKTSTRLMANALLYLGGSSATPITPPKPAAPATPAKSATQPKK